MTQGRDYPSVKSNESWLSKEMPVDSGGGKPVNLSTNWTRRRPEGVKKQPKHQQTYHDTQNRAKKVMKNGTPGTGRRFPGEELLGGCELETAP